MDVDDGDLRRFGPKQADHPSIGEPCPACRQPFKEDEYTTLVTLGPGDDPEAQKRAREGRVYNAMAVEVSALELRDRSNE